ncbi:MAG: PorT family protein [Bacteroidia bacterium]|nr:PorT family protein [Bacteroidia bacterium]MDW8088508.1 porin family protein [Bacteroidia bacterium]
MRLYRLVGLGALLWGQVGRPWQIGFQIGPNIPAYRTTQHVDKAVTLPGFTAGLVLRFPLAGPFYFQSGLYFNRRRSAYLLTESTPEDTVIGRLREEYIVHTTNDGQLTLAHLELPCLLEWNFLTAAHGRSYFLSGFHLGYLLYSRNVGTTRVALEGLDFLPLFGFPPQTRLIVAEGPVDNTRLRFRQPDLGVWMGGGSAHKMGPGQMTFELRFFTALINILQRPLNQRFYNGSLMLLMGYIF